VRQTLALIALFVPAAALASSTPTTEGRLATRVGRETVDVPLKHTDVKIHVVGLLAETTVEQVFHNPYPNKIDAVYLFPLPTGAAVNHLEIVNGGRTLTGEIKPREEAHRKFVEAKNKGQVAALLTEERPNLFTQQVANLEPGVELTVRLRYAQSLEYDAGRYELAFPMVAGPRYVPKTSHADATAVQPAVLPPGMRSSHDISLAVELEGGVPIHELESPSHRIVERGARDRFHVELDAGDTIPNKDFILRWRVAGARPELALLAHRDPDHENEGSFFMMAQPPDHAADADVTPRELIFVVDTSSSMAGRPLKKAREVVHRALAGLRADDAFQIVRFDDAASALGPRMLAPSANNVRWALAWLDALPAAGGTEMIGGLEAALALPHDPARLRVVVLLTDGYLGNEDEVLASAVMQLGEARLFSFGVGSAVNRWLLEELARLGRGAAVVVRPDEDTARAVDKLYARIDRPLLTDVRVDWGGLDVVDVTPHALPDLFAGQPLVVAGRYRAPGHARVIVRAREAGRAVEFPLDVTLPERDVSRPAVPLVWARARIAELERKLIRGPDADAEHELRELALRRSLMSRYTAFVVVDESRATAGKSETVMVPVEVPDGVRAGVGYGGGGLGGLSISSHGAGYGGGVGEGTIGLGSIGTIGKGAGGSSFGSAHYTVHVHHVAAAPDIQVGEVRVLGSLDKSIIRRVVHRHLNEVRFCYEKEAQRRKLGEGRVELAMVIDSSTGRVTSAGIASTTLDSADVENCIADRAAAWEFPQAPQGGIVQVNYPFVLKLAADDSKKTVLTPDPYPEDSP
jgi:Ca-activated chloride channel family protein